MRIVYIFRIEESTLTITKFYRVTDRFRVSEFNEHVVPLKLAQTEIIFENTNLEFKTVIDHVIRITDTSIVEYWEIFSKEREYRVSDLRIMNS